MFSLHTSTKTLPALLVLVFFILGFLSPFTQVGFAQNNGTTTSTAQAYTQLTEMTSSDLAAKNQNFGCFGDGPPDSSRIAGCMAAGAYYLLFVPSNWFAGFMGLFFNYTLFKLVVGMGTVVNELSGVMIAWSVLRDVANIFLVFLTIYIGIATILNISGYGYKQLLWRVILAAIFVNFSVTFTKAIIDVSNFFAVETYSLFIHGIGNSPTVGSEALTDTCTDAGAGAATANPGQDRCITHGLASVFWSELKIMTSFDINQTMQNANAANASTGAQIQWKMALTAVMSAIMFILLAFLLGVAGFLLVTRFVILIFLLIVSPVALTALLTGVAGLGKGWWKTLIDQSIFAPLLLLMWWVAYVIMHEFMGGASGTIGSDFLSASSLEIIVNFIIVMGFLIAGLVIAKSLGAHGANASINLGKRWAKTGTAFLAGGAAAYPVGWASRSASNLYTRRMAEANEKDENGKYVRNSLLARGRRMASGTFVDRGMNKVLDAGANKKFFGTKSYSDRRTASEKAGKERKGVIEKEMRGQELKGAISSKDPSDITRTRKIMRDTSYDNLMEHRDLIAKNPGSIAHVNNATYKKILENKDKKFSDNEIAEFKKARINHFMGIKGEDLQKEISGASPKDLTEHDTQFLKRDDVVKQLDAHTLNGMVRNGLSREKRDAIRTTVEAQYQEIAKKQRGSSGVILAPDGTPASGDAPKLTDEEQNIVNLYKWFNDDNRLYV